MHFKYLITYVIVPTYVTIFLFNIIISRNFYNWTWNYRKDSDIVASYGPSFTKMNESPPFKMIKSHYEPEGYLQNT